MERIVISEMFDETGKHKFLNRKYETTGFFQRGEKRESYTAYLGNVNYFLTGGKKVFCCAKTGFLLSQIDEPIECCGISTIVTEDGQVSREYIKDIKLEIARKGRTLIHDDFLAKLYYPLEYEILIDYGIVRSIAER